MKKAVIIFQKNPEPGKVKTRLAATIGNENALKVYNVLVEHTHFVAQNTEARKYLFFSNFIENHAQWEGYEKRIQQGNDLGLRMFNAIQEVKDDGYSAIVVIGTDCYELTAEILDQALTSLESNDYCIGPAIDGGYYLIGTREADKAVFLNKEWSTETVYEEAKASILSLNKTLETLPALSDVDYEEDLKTLRQFIEE